MNSKILYFIAGIMNIIAGAVWLFSGDNRGIVFICLGAIMFALGRSQQSQ